MATLSNPGWLKRASLKPLSMEDFRSRVIAGGRLVALLAAPRAAGLGLLAVLASPPDQRLEVVSTHLQGDAYPALTPECPAAHWFEREMAETWGVRPEGHPWLKPIRFSPPMRPAGQAAPPVGVTDFFAVAGEEVHEVAVGPVHAGVIEPGHFRFQCNGERVLHLEISLGYQHRGVERALVGGPDRRTIHYMETLAGDTTVGHALAWCLNREALAGGEGVPARAWALRSVALELERLANHVGDLGAMAGDVGYLPTSSFCGRLRGDLLNLTMAVCGNRMGRGWVRPGGVGADLDGALVRTLRDGLRRAMIDCESAVGLLWKSSSVGARMRETGTVSLETALNLGLVGPVARASGLEYDVRRDHPWGAYAEAPWPVAIHQDGDVFARARVRWEEMLASADFILAALDRLEEGPVWARPGPMEPEALSVALVEGWRGEICHVALTDASGRLAAYKVVDPSFHNWFGLTMAMRNEQISDFPLCNKSFNLSYCGHDL